ncbi:multiple sugar transport system permease protein [Ruminococcaceae bacterium YRB3002]|nr:multiple sugar transport system permease protein [Ruminococcaceae bacterium YRB3002]
MSANNEPKLRSKSASIRAYSIMVYVVVIFFSILAVIPFWFMFMNATWDTMSIQRGIKLWPNPNAFKQLGINWENLAKRSTFSFAVGFKNSLIISVSATALTVYFSALTAYGLTVYRFKGRKTIFAIIVGVMMVPTAVNITGFYRMMSAMGLLGSKWPLILPAIAAPSTVFFIKQYLETSLSMEIVEASRIDGAGEFYTFNRICLPIMIPSLATQGIFSFLGTWNNFFAPSILLSRNEDKTLPLMVAQLYGDRYTDYGMIYMGLSASVLPVVIVYAFLQRYIISGVAAGGVKE